MPKILKKRILNCHECPYYKVTFKTFPYRMLCTYNSGYKIIAESGSPNMGKLPYDIPEWCELEDGE
jgi:hypothetical protein